MNKWIVGRTLLLGPTKSTRIYREQNGFEDPQIHVLVHETHLHKHNVENSEAINAAGIRFKTLYTLYKY